MDNPYEAGGARVIDNEEDDDDEDGVIDEGYMAYLRRTRRPSYLQPWLCCGRGVRGFSAADIAAWLTETDTPEIRRLIAKAISNSAPS